MPEHSLEGVNYAACFGVGPLTQALPPVEGTINDAPDSIFNALKADVAEGDIKTRIITGLSGAAMFSVWAAGVTKAPFIVMPKVAFGVLQETGSPVEASAATGVLFGAWSLMVAETFNEGMRRYPTMVKAISNKFPSRIEHFSHTLPGLEASDNSADTARRLHLTRNIGSRMLTHFRRGVASMGVGIVPYIATSHINGRPLSAIRKLSGELGLDSGLAMTGFSALAVGAGVTTPEWYAAAGVLMAGEWLQNKRKVQQAAEL